MKQLRRIPAVLLALVLALTMGIGPVPTALLAAPAAQETDPAITGYYESDVLESADSPGLVVGLFLYEDGSAEVTSDYMNDTDIIIEVGTWTDNGDGTLTLTVTGTTEGDYEAPIELVFEIAEDGSLVIPGEPGGAFGEAGLTLIPTEAPTEETEEATGEATPEATGEETPEATGEAPAGESANDALALIPEGAMVFQSDVLPQADGSSVQITLAAAEDGTLWMVSDYLAEGDIVTEIGTWTEDADGNLVVSLTGQLGAGGEADTEYDAPVELVFAVNDDGSLSLVDEGGALFGDGGLTLLPVEGTTGAEAVTATDVTTSTVTTSTVPSGPYVSDLLPGADQSDTFLVAIFYDDGNALISTYMLNGDLPVQEVGTWAANVDGTFTITATGTVDEEYAEPVEVEFTIDEEGVILLAGVPLYPLAEIDLAAAPSVIAVFESDVITYTTDATHTVTLSLYDDFSAELATNYVEDGEVAVEYGEWDLSEDNQILLTITGDAETDYPEPVEMIFDLADDGTLTLANDEEGYYGEQGLTLLPVEIEGELVGDTAPAGTTEEGTPTPTEEAPADEATPEAGATEAEATPAATEEAAAEEGTGDAAASAGADSQIFQSDVLPAATGEGLQLTLALFDDGTAALDYDYLDGEEVATNLGTWVDNGDGTFTLTFTEGPTGEFDPPIELDVELDDTGNLTIVDATEESAGLLDVVLAPVILE